MLCSLTVLLSWLWYRVEGNIFIIALAHASVNAPEIFIENRFKYRETGEQLILKGWLVLSLAYLSVAIMIVLGNWKLWNIKPVGKPAEQLEG